VIIAMNMFMNTRRRTVLVSQKKMGARVGRALVSAR
jgi:hypothetical protein